MPVDPIKLMRKAVDELLGPNRNGDKPQVPVTHWSDDRVCKYDLCGLCPHQLFPNTKQDLGPCPYQICPVPEKYKKQFREEKAKAEASGDGLDVFQNHERQLERFLERLVRDCDDKIARANRRLEAQQGTSGGGIAAAQGLHANAAGNGAASAANGPEAEELARITAELSEMTRQMGELGEMGEIDAAQELNNQIQELQRRKEALEMRMPAVVQKSGTGGSGGGPEQQLTVCEYCGAFLSVNESAQRLADHFNGKMHIGFQKIREKLKEQQDSRANKQRRDQHYAPSQSQSSSSSSPYAYGYSSYGYDDRYGSSRSSSGGGYYSSSGGGGGSSSGYYGSYDDKSRSSSSRSSRDDYGSSGDRYYSSSSSSSSRRRERDDGYGGSSYSDSTSAQADGRSDYSERSPKRRREYSERY